ncbi:MAG: hypothetical protein K2O05_00325 [Anaeroplasmataceae bacterium]|nr:hypothetical protein [Anaeroplasmataceae bacterium]MDE7100282.1 hypothetical protein [Anaeroplasmataceae bacterium]
MNIENLKYVSASLITVICTVLVYIKNHIKNKRIKKILAETEVLAKELIPNILEAEKFKSYSGEEKKTYVMVRMLKYAMEHKIKIDEDELSKKIDEMVCLTKQVNYPTNEDDFDEVAITRQIEKIIEEKKKNEV